MALVHPSFYLATVCSAGARAAFALSIYMTNPSSLIPGRKVFVIGASYGYASWMESKLVNRIEDADFVCATGGEDIDASRYHRRSHFSSYSNPARDAREFPQFDRARELGKPIIGVCRGAQAMAVYAGGQLVQDQMNPLSYHPMETIDGKRVVVSSSHHQAQLPWGLPADEFKVLGWTKGLSSYHWGEYDGDELVIGRAPGDIEVEECWYPKIRALALQHHPEFSFGDYGRDARATEYIDHCRNLLDRLLDGTL